MICLGSWCQYIGCRVGVHFPLGLLFVHYHALISGEEHPLLAQSGDGAFDVTSHLGVQRKYDIEAISCLVLQLPSTFCCDFVDGITGGWGEGGRGC